MNGGRLRLGCKVIVLSKRRLFHSALPGSSSKSGHWLWLSYWLWPRSWLYHCCRLRLWSILGLLGDLSCRFLRLFRLHLLLFLLFLLCSFLLTDAANLVQAELGHFNLRLANPARLRLNLLLGARRFYHLDDSSIFFWLTLTF